LINLQSLPILIRRRTATILGAVLLGVAALVFAYTADWASKLFLIFYAHAPYATLVVTPAGLGIIVALTKTYYPLARGSGIPQVIVGCEDPRHAVGRGLVSIPTAVFKVVMTVLALSIGASVGREGPTVQISAAIMAMAHRLLKIDLSAAVVIAGGAAGVSAAFNTPLAGVAFAIEELAAAYQQRLALLAMVAVMISGMVSLGLSGDYVYFGEMHQSIPFLRAILISPIAGVIGGLTGGLFSLGALQFGESKWPPVIALRSHPITTAVGCGFLIAVIGVATNGATWGAGYDTAKQLVESIQQPLWFGPAKFATTLITMVSGTPGGIFAPSLAAGAGLGNIIAAFFPHEPLGPIVLLGMIGYFVGVVRAPLTAVLIISEMTDSRAMVLPFLIAAIIADACSALVCKERLYHGLSKAFIDPANDERMEADEGL
jgi:H+/Cl- antiporter ClcA